jgi:exopolysaccharide biosynthesis polyprenyl glycosylphosphotransferase
MHAQIAAAKPHEIDFLAEVASRTRTAAPHRSRVAMRLGLVAAVGDALVLALAMAAAFWMRFHSGLPEKETLDQAAFENYFAYVALAEASALAILTCFGLYDPALLLNLRQTWNRVIKGWAMWTCALLMLGTLLNFEPSISRVFLATVSAFGAAGLLVWHAAFHRFCQREPIAAQLRKRVLILGWNAEADRLAHLIENSPDTPYRCAGYVPAPGQSLSPRPASVECLGEYAELAEILKYSLIDIVILADHQLTHGKVMQIANICEREIVQFQLIPSYFEILLAGLHLQNFRGIPMLGVSKLPLNEVGARLIKRACDIVGGFIGLLISAPVIALFGLLVVLESPGPVFYRQRRSGRNGVPFSIIKLRSMRVDAETNGAVGWSTKEDPRRLRIGAFMRRWNLDELPQFWNVLKGEMSLVGPRPERPELIATFKHYIPHYNARHTVKPGITGWAQIHGLRGDTDLEARIQHDLYYMENWSIWIDIHCLVCTLCARHNAY